MRLVRRKVASSGRLRAWASAASMWFHSVGSDIASLTGVPLHVPLETVIYG